MLKFTLQRLGWMLLALLGVVLLSFFLIHFIPGDPVEIMLGETAAQADKINLRHELGLDLPLGAQLFKQVKELTQLNLGQSLNSRLPVLGEILDHFPATIELSLAALFLALLWGLPLGIWSAVYANTWRDHCLSILSLIAMSVPGVFLGPALIYVFAIRLEWFPISDRGGLAHLMLPAISLAVPLGAVIAKMSRTALVEVLNEDYMRTARAKGVGTLALYFKHALFNAAIPIVTILGLQLSALLTGTVITETIFDWPGIGMLLFSAIQQRDYPMVQGTVLFVASIYVLVNWLTDLTYGVVNPRVRRSVNA